MAGLKSASRRKIGGSGLTCAPIGFGCMSLSGIYGPSDDDAGIRLVQHALDAGVDMLDSANAYGWGHNEELLAKALAGGRRKGVVVATKFGQYLAEGGRQLVNGKPDYVLKCAEESLSRLRIDTIDLYYAHRIDPTVPIEDTVGAMKRLVEQGKVRALGLSEARPDTIRRAHKVHPIAAVQMECSLLYRSEATEVLEMTRALGISLVAYSPLGRSLLTGAVQAVTEIKDARSRFPRFAGNNLAKNLGYVERIAAMAREKGCTPAQLALAWVLAQGDDIVPIPGTKSASRLDENIAAIDVRLTAAEVARLSAAVPLGAGAGDRYPEAMMGALYR
ncbi:MAG: aldo/keto reductase [Alphaproteobacteria bacterium]|nr:aldo/keto reductase [Alphaproteobacteria bacterium]